MRIEIMEIDKLANKVYEAVNSDSEHRFLELIESLPKVSVQGYDKDRKVIYWNQSSTEIYGYSQAEAVGKKLEDLIIPDAMKSEVIRLHAQWLEEGIPIPSAELILLKKNGQSIPVFSSHVMLKEHTDSPEMFCVDIDLTEQYEAREKLELIATTDSLTKLPNRRFLEEMITSMISSAKNSGDKLAVLLIDLDMFKEINDTLGHSWGDKLLFSVAERMKKVLREVDFLARFGGDEFVLLIPNTSTKQVKLIAQGIINTFKRSFPLDDEKVFITASLGVSMFPEDGSATEELLKNADAAMYHAKENGRNRFHFFTQELSDKLQRQRDIAAQLQSSLKRNEFELVYQPQYNMQTKKITSCEALLRWRPTKSELAVSPDVFIPIAERSDLIVRIGEWVVERACAQSRAWKDLGIDIQIDINISGKQLEHEGFFDLLEHYRCKYNLAPRDIGIELTEHTLIKSNDAMLDNLRAEREQGVSISIDDFGTGYSSLNYLKLFPLTNLKIDRAFVADAPDNDLDGALLEAIVNVGHKLNLKIVVEGIETELQANFCKRLNIDSAQGYWYCKPLLADDMLKLLLEN